MITVHACTMILVHACTMIIVNACILFKEHVLDFKGLMFGAFEGGGLGAEALQISTADWEPQASQ